ncbi:BolA family protein [Salaquimonas pukyongi]|uniref:BolA family protein n=1 Tax=Salaquimonas pukyongi TaxID=2712698 RepID=UPI00096B8C25|nr:BolA family protein [Salaquimonas pukyongi]
MGIIQNIEDQIRSELAPAALEIINESHLHAGHQESFDGTGETHLRIKIVAEAFEGLSRLERHRRINALVAGEMEKGLHAIAIEAKAPSELS